MTKLPVAIAYLVLRTGKWAECRRIVTGFYVREPGWMPFAVEGLFIKEAVVIRD